MLQPRRGFSPDRSVDVPGRSCEALSPSILMSNAKLYALLRRWLETLLDRYGDPNGEALRLQVYSTVSVRGLDDER